MDLRLVELFCDVVQQRSFSKAAAAHGLSQPAVSTNMQTLESELGVELIDRSQRPWQPTPAGRVLFARARGWLDEYRAIVDEVRNQPSAVTGHVRIAAIYSAGISGLDALVKRFQELHPAATCDLQTFQTEEVYERLENDAADLGLVSFPRTRGGWGSVPWQRQRMVLVVPPGHRLAGRASVAVEELEGESFAGFDDRLPIRREVKRWLKEAGVTVKIVHCFDSIGAVKDAVEEGTGVAILPQPTVERAVQKGALSMIPLSGVEWFRPLGIVFRKQKPLSQAARKFVDLLQSEAGSAGAEPDDGGAPRSGRTAAGSNGARKRRRRQPVSAS